MPHVRCVSGWVCLIPTCHFTRLCFLVSAVIRGVTAVVHLRKSTAGSKQITCPQSYRLTNHKTRIFLFRGILKPVGEQTHLRGIQYIPNAFLSEQISFLWILTHQSSQM